MAFDLQGVYIVRNSDLNSGFFLCSSIFPFPYSEYYYFIYVFLKDLLARYKRRTFIIQSASQLNHPAANGITLNMLFYCAPFQYLFNTNTDFGGISSPLSKLLNNYLTW